MEIILGIFVLGCCYCLYKQCRPHTSSRQPGDQSLMTEVHVVHDTISHGNCRKSTGSKNHYIIKDEKEVVQLAIDNGTVLWANQIEVFINTRGDVHAEILLINILNEAQNPMTIETIHIENSPCRDCSKALIKYFRHYHQKPTILVGQIYHLNYSDRNDEGLKNMMRAGFKFKVWQAMHDRRYRGDDTTTRNYLDRLMHSL